MVSRIERCTSSPKPKASKLIPTDLFNTVKKTKYQMTIAIAMKGQKQYNHEYQSVTKYRLIATFIIM